MLPVQACLNCHLVFFVTINTVKMKFSDFLMVRQFSIKLVCTRSIKFELLFLSQNYFNIPIFLFYNNLLCFSLTDLNLSKGVSLNWTSPNWYCPAHT